MPKIWTPHYAAFIKILINLLAVNVLELMTPLHVLETLPSVLTVEVPISQVLPSAAA
jgi:hypothetical protein